MKKVLNVVGTIANGGIEKVIENLYGNMDISLIKCEIAIHGYSKEYKDDETLAKYVKYLVPSYYTVNALSYRHWWKNFASGHHYDIIHVHYIDSSFLYVDFFKRDGSIIILHSHNTRRNPPTLGLFISELNCFFSRYKTDYAFACSKQAAIDRLGKKLALSDRTIILKNGIDLTKFYYDPILRKETRKNLGLSDSFVLGHIGRFNFQKNHSFLINVFEKVHEIDSSAKLLLIGDGEDKNNIIKIVENKNLSSSVVFLGNREDIPALLNAMDVFVFPSMFEGLGIVLIEAQATGLRIVASNHIQEEADMGAGLLSKFSLDAPIDLWVRNILEKKYCERKDCREYVKKSGYDVRNVSRWLEDFIFSISDGNLNNHFSKNR